MLLFGESTTNLTEYYTGGVLFGISIRGHNYFILLGLGDCHVGQGEGEFQLEE